MKNLTKLFGTSILLLSLPLSAQKSQPPFPWRFVEVSTLDTGNPEALIDRFWEATIDGNGRVSLGYPNSSIIQMFTSDGEWQHNIDKEGEGPGEYRGVFDLTASRSGDLLIYDMSEYRITHLTDDGSFTALINKDLGNLSGRWLVECLAFAGFERYWLYHTQGLGGPRSPETDTILLIDQSGEVIWTSEEWDGLIHSLEYRSEVGRYRVIADPAGRLVRWTVDPDGTAYIISPDCDRMLIVDQNGRITNNISINLPPISYTSREWNVSVREYTATLEGSSNSAQRESAKYFETELRKSRTKLSPIQRLWWGGPEGLLVDRSPVTVFPISAEHQRKYAALMPNGQMTEEEYGPGGLVAVANGFALSHRSDEDGLPILTLYRLLPK